MKKLILAAILLAGCTREPMTSRVVAERHVDGIYKPALVAEDRSVCFENYRVVIAAEIGKPFACRWEK